MRNMFEYPLTIDEVIDTMQALQLDIVENYEKALMCGDMTALVLKAASDFIGQNRSIMDHWLKIYNTDR